MQKDLVPKVALWPIREKNSRGDITLGQQPQGVTIRGGRTDLAFEKSQGKQCSPKPQWRTRGRKKNPEGEEFLVLRYTILWGTGSPGKDDKGYKKTIVTLQDSF